MPGSGTRRLWHQRISVRGGITAMIVMGLAIAGIQAAFPNAHNNPPAGWPGPVFTLSQAYPATLPNLEPLGKRKWAQLDFKNPLQAPQYLKAVLDYCLEGNTANNFADVSQNAVRTWYHTPWLHADSNNGGDGREFIHGLTKERTSQVTELGPGQTGPHENWAVGFYNPRGGFTIGQVWKDPAHPDPRKAVFPSHTVTCKLLFTTTPVTEAPYLDGSLEWQADINRASGTGARPTLRLLQVDVAVKDPRAVSTTGWVFGTFQYEKAASASPNWWEHLVPVGLMWGSDLAHLKLDQQTQEEWINTARGQQLHLGRKNLVLNGPVDNPNGSCTACHGFAQVGRVNNPMPTLRKTPPGATVTGPLFESYFTNIKAATPLSVDYVSVDYSLQLQIGIARAINSGQATLPTNLNPVGRGRGLVQPVATHLEEVRRDGY
jgi:hypothetical protein